MAGKSSRKILIASLIAAAAAAAALNFLVVRTHTRYQPLENWKDEILYAVFIDRFFDGDTSNNNPAVPRSAADFQGGDLRGVAAKLDYIKALGATTVVLNPVMPTSSFHGYHPFEHYSIEPRYGTLEDFDTLIAEAHARGLKVIFDLVTNHVSNESPLLKKHPEWFRPKKRWAPEVWEDRHDQSFLDLPDFDQANEAAYRYILDFAKFWVDRGIDGFRMDAVNLVAPDYWRRLNADIRRHAGPNFFILGEIWETESPALDQYVNDFDSAYDFTFTFFTRRAFLSGRPAAPGSFTFANGAGLVNKRLILSPFIDNHDLSRFITTARETLGARAEPRFKQALVLLLTCPGLSYIFYGTEIALEDEPHFKDSYFDEGRSKMRFDENEKKAPFQLIARLASVRKTFKLGRRRFSQIPADAGLLVYELRAGENAPRVVVIHNLNSTGWNTPPKWLGASSMVTDLLTGEKLELPLAVGGDESRVISVE